MTQFARTLRNRREIQRNRRAVAEAIGNAASPALRADLIAAAQRSDVRS